MRPDTPQKYEHILVEDVKGNANNFISIRPWTQFFDMKGEIEIPISYSSNIMMRNIDLNCNTFLNIEESDQYKLSKFTFENLNIKTKKESISSLDYIENVNIKNVEINGEKKY